MRTFRWFKCCGSKRQYAGSGKFATCPTCKESVSLDNVPYCIQYQHMGRQTIKVVGLKKDADALLAQVQLAQYRDEPLPMKEPPIMWQDAIKLFVAHNEENTKANTIAFYRQMLKPLTDEFGHRPLHSITAIDVVRYRTERLKSIGPRTANHELQTLQRFYGVICKLYPIRTHNKLHVASIEIGSIDRLAEPTKDRALTMAEIKTMWNNLDQLGESSANALKLILLTGQRPGEVCGITPAEIDGRWWTIPAERSKNGIPQRVWLCDTAMALIGRPLTTANWLPTPLLRSKQDNGLMLGVQPFTPHDLRRTMATQLAGMDFPDEVIDAVLNHAKRGVIKVYNRHKYDSQKQAAWEAWEGKLLSFVNGEVGEVIQFRQASNG